MFLAKKLNSNILYLFILYLLTNLFFLLNLQGAYWDDWVLINQKPETIITMYAQTGFIWMGYLHLLFQYVGNGIYFYRIIAFFAYFFSGVFLFYILQRTKYFEKNTIFFISLLFLLSPVDYARVALINTFAILTEFIFYFAFFLLTIYLDSKKKIYNRIIILALFFISFSLESLLVFYSIVLFYIFYDFHQKNEGKPRLLLIKNFLTYYFDFISLPLVFFTLKHSYLQPYGLYSGYNSLSFDLIPPLKLIVESFITSLYLPIKEAFDTALSHSILISLILVMVFYLLKENLLTFQKIPKIKKEVIAMSIIGFILFLLAVLPYCAVGKLPQLDNWGSKNQILVPLGMSFLIYSFITPTALVHKKVPALLMSGIISLFVIQGLYSYYKFDMDWFYQVSLLEQFKQSSVVRENSTFIVKDNLEMDVWTTKRGLSFYEVSGLLKKAFNEDSRLMVHDISHLESYQQYRDHPQYNFSHWNKETPVYIEFSRNPTYQLTWDKKIKLFFDSVFDQKAFEENVRNLTEITYQHPTEI